MPPFSKSLKRRIVNITSLAEKKEQLHEKYGARKYKGEHRRIIACIKRALTQNRLAGIQAAKCHLHNNPDQAAAVVTQLNVLIGHRALLFQWLPANCHESGKLLIRNESIGLLIKTDPDSAPKGMKITPNEPAPFCSLTAEAALSALSLQACRQAGGACTAPTMKGANRVKAANRGRVGNHRLRLLLNTAEGVGQSN